MSEPPQFTAARQRTPQEKEYISEWRPGRMPKRILVTGSREWTDAYELGMALLYAGIGTPWPKITVVHGAAVGADSMADTLTKWFRGKVEPYPVSPQEWRRFGKEAGHLRNQKMVDLGADICLAFPTASSRGTWDCVRRAEKAGIPVKIYKEAA